MARFEHLSVEKSTAINSSFPPVSPSVAITSFSLSNCMLWRSIVRLKSVGVGLMVACTTSSMLASLKFASASGG